MHNNKTELRFICIELWKPHRYFWNKTLNDQWILYEGDVKYIVKESIELPYKYKQRMKLMDQTTLIMLRK